MRDYIPSPQRRVAVNLLPQLRVGVLLVRRGDSVSERSKYHAERLVYNYFSVNWRPKGADILQE